MTPGNIQGTTREEATRAAPRGAVQLSQPLWAGGIRGGQGETHAGVGHGALPCRPGASPGLTLPYTEGEDRDAEGENRDAEGQPSPAHMAESDHRAKPSRAACFIGQRGIQEERYKEEWLSTKGCR